jgi:PAS domain S-box-containing protein
VSQTPHTGTEIRRAFHELQVHQVELEQQNHELEQMRERLQSLLENYTDLYDFAPVGYLSVDETGRIVEANLTSATLLGIERSRLLGRHLAPLAPPSSRRILEAFLAQVFASTGKQVCEVTLRKPDGTKLYASLHGATAWSPDRSTKLCRLALSNLAGFKREEEARRRVEALAAANEEAHQELRRREAVEASLRQSELTQRELLAESQTLHMQLRHLTHQILLAQEEERKAISRELHDEVAQILAGINVHLAVLNQEETLDRRSLRQRVMQTQRLVGHSVEVVHRYARRLRPSMLDDLGLIPALRSYIHDLPGRKGLRIRFSASSAVEALDNTRRTMLYRVAQEALTNVTRHAQATVVTVRIQTIARTVRLTVRDNGKSFKPDQLLAAPASQRLGLLGMRERVELVGGRLLIESSPGQGTVVRAEIPYHDGDNGVP